MSLFNQSKAKIFDGVFGSLLVFCLLGSLAYLTSCNIPRRTKVSDDVRRVRAAKQVVLEDKVQEFGSSTHKFRILPPKGFLFSQIDTPDGQVFSFTTPPRKDSRNGVLTISCVANKAGHKHVLPSAVLTSVLGPLAQGCIDFHQASVDTFDINGQTFIGTEFTGSYGGYYPIKGYVAVAELEDGFYIVQWQDGEVHYHLTRGVMQKSFESLEIAN